MTKPDPSAELYEARLDRRRCRVGSNPQPRCGPPDQRAIPDGSAAAISNRCRVCSGRTSTRRRNVSSISPDNGIAPGNPNPPANSAGVNPRGNSSKASGLP